MTSPSSQYRSSSRVRVLVVASILVVSQPDLLYGEDLCRPSQTAMECFEDMVGRATQRKGGTPTPAMGNAIAAGNQEANEAISTATTGPTQGKAFSSTLTNFASFLTGAFDFLDVNQESEAITLELRVPAPPGSQARLQAVVRRPTVSEEVTSVAPEEKRAEARTSLEKELGDFDDTEVSLLVELGAKTSTRRLAGQLNAKAYEGIADAGERAQSAKKRLESLLDGITNGWDLRYADFGADDRGRLDSLLRELGEAETSVMETHQRVRRRWRTDRLGDLLANESQLYATVGYVWRDPLVGREGLTAKLTWEYGFTNLTRFRKDHVEECGTVTQGCLEAFSAWIDSEASAQLKNADRAALSVDYSDQPAYSVSQPAYGIELDKERAYSLRIQAKYSRNLLGEGARTPMRLDLSAGYEDVRKDPARNDRFVATGTITVRLSDTLQLPVGLVYANRPEYVGEVDKNLGAHIGLVFRPAE